MLFVRQSSHSYFGAITGRRIITMHHLNAKLMVTFCSIATVYVLLLEVFLFIGGK